MKQQRPIRKNQNMNAKEDMKMNNKIHDNLIGNKLRRARFFSDYTAKDIGILSGFSEDTADVRMCQYENGQRKPTYKTAKRLADVLGISPIGLLPLDLSTEEGLYHIIIKMIEVYDIKLYKDGDRYSLIIPTNHTKLWYYLEYLYSAHVMRRNNKMSDDEYLYIADGVDVRIDNKYLDDAVPLKRATQRYAEFDFEIMPPIIKIDNEDEANKTFNRYYDFMQSMVLHDDDIVIADMESDYDDELMNKAMGIPLNKTPIMSFEKCIDELYAKLEAEHNDWLSEVKKLPVDEIVNFAGEITFREGLLAAFKDGTFLSCEQIKALMELDNVFEHISDYCGQCDFIDDFTSLVEKTIKDFSDIKLYE